MTNLIHGSFTSQALAAHHNDNLETVTIVVKKKQVISMDRVMQSDKYRPKLTLKEHSHGFMKPYSLHQIISWVVFSLCVLIQIMGILPQALYASSGEYPTMFSVEAFLFLVSDIAVIMLAYKTTVADPSDMLVREERYCRLTKQNFPEE